MLPVIDRRVGDRRGNLSPENLDWLRPQIEIYILRGWTAEQFVMGGPGSIPERRPIITPWREKVANLYREIQAERMVPA